MSLEDVVKWTKVSSMSNVTNTFKKEQELVLSKSNENNEPCFPKTSNVHPRQSKPIWEVGSSERPLKVTNKAFYVGHQSFHYLYCHWFPGFVMPFKFAISYWGLLHTDSYIELCQTSRVEFVSENI